MPRGERGPLRAWSLAILRRSSRRPAPSILDRGNGGASSSSSTSRRWSPSAAAIRGEPESDVLTRLIQGESDGERLTESELITTASFC